MAEFSAVWRALASLLCSDSTEAEVPLARGFTVTAHRIGLFAFLNLYAEQLLERLYADEMAPVRPLVDKLYDTRLTLYGGDSLRHHFLEHSRNCVTKQMPLEEARRVIHSTPRYHLVSQLLRLLFQPRQPIAAPSTRYALAVHARRGDKLFAKGRERIALPSADLLARTAIRLLGTIRRPAVLIASDDGPFASEFARILRRGAPGVRVEVQATNLSSHHQCDASCIPPLQALVVSFSRAGRLLVSLRSNMGGYLLASWSGLNGRSTPPPFVDLDGRVKDDALGDRYFCSLRWGSRAGLCAPGERFDRMASCTAQASPKVVECCANATAARVLACRACPRTPPVCSARIYDRDA